METGATSDVWIFTAHVPESQMRDTQNCLFGKNRNRRRKSIRGAFPMRRKPLLGRVGMACVLLLVHWCQSGTQRRGFCCVWDYITGTFYVSRNPKNDILHSRMSLHPRLTTTDLHLDGRETMHQSHCDQCMFVKPVLLISFSVVFG
jgi:hypothetical protein